MITPRGKSGVPGIGILRQQTRDVDVAARYGGEEFAVVLPVTGPEDSLSYAECLRAAGAGYPWPLRPVTISLGLATRIPDTRDARELVRQADAALYESKRRGRNRATHHASLPEPSRTDHSAMRRAGPPASVSESLAPAGSS